MKQLSPATRPFIQSYFRHCRTRRLVSFSQCLTVLLFAGLAIPNSSFKSDNSLVSSQNLMKQSVPFKGQFTFSFAGNEASGTGTGTHVGSFTLEEQNNLEGFPVISGSAVITAANGDQIFANHAGLVDFIGEGLGNVNSEFTITGGTGRFARATGRFQSDGHVNLALGTGSFMFEGEISY